MGTGKNFLLLLVCAVGLRVCSSNTDPQDVLSLRSLMSQWKNPPSSWEQSSDPCGSHWDGVFCINSRVTMLKLSTMGLRGTLSGNIGQLTELHSLDLSFNSDLSGSLPPSIGNLKQLTILILSGCSFSGEIPSELGSLSLLSFLALNSNKFNGTIPASLGQLSALYWLDLADNQLTGTLPISRGNEPGLDLLHHTKHFHFNKNQLSGQIPEQLFSSNMSLIHLLLDGNQFSGTVPASIGLVKTLQVLRLDRNFLTGEVPMNLNNLTNANELNLAHNKLTGAFPDLTGMVSLSYLDLSNNLFDPTAVPVWFSELQSLVTLVIESGGLSGLVPQELFSIPGLQRVYLKNNSFNGTLSLGNSISQQLQLVDLQNNAITSLVLPAAYNGTLILIGNPVCNGELSSTVYCRTQEQKHTPYSTNITKCGNITCLTNQSVNPQTCACAYPYEGVMVFRAPTFSDVTNSTVFQSLEMSLWTQLELTPGAVSIQNVLFNNDNYLQMQVKLFPSDGVQFNRTEISRIGTDLSNQKYKPPSIFGPYYFVASPYPIA